MRSRSRIIVAVVSCAAVAVAPLASAAEPEKLKSKIRESAYYEFRGRVSDRNTVDKTFTVEWEKGSQVVVVRAETKIFRKGRAATLADAKSGDATRGIGKVIKGRLVAIAVAFGAHAARDVLLRAHRDVETQLLIDLLLELFLAEQPDQSHPRDPDPVHLTRCALPA